ncbi:MAG TPA: hypothetical protein PLD74_08425 [Prolixibacteraceae bacterium]|jgi:hypothetical protein|nr:MAG: hypothetical protein BWX87_01625 [Bacteroidetes bacterium ADurb.Bin123]HNU78805.1 hypothetical protein [Prolixibacteraceae bacterium]HOF56069.1 hypothetical protein [Prolixibacteraceae bacterium]HOS01028.1 hypothetical protein [Prolixibacteraceae bacterium]HOS89221.1 hypothetical protein [Prolixibacteraceae bacterium]
MDQPKTDRLLRIMKMVTGNTSANIGMLARKPGILERSFVALYRHLPGGGFDDPQER